MRNFVVILSCVCLLFMIEQANAQEKIFANYFDIVVNSPQNSEVIGRIHIERNKDVSTKPIPSTYNFEISVQPNREFRIETRRDPAGRLFGVLVSDKTLNSIGDISITVVLKDGLAVLNTIPITVKVVNETLLTTLFNRYKDKTLADYRMYGIKYANDLAIDNVLEELESNQGKFAGANIYNINPKDWKASGNFALIDDEWAGVAAKIGGLGYAYGKATGKYGTAGTAINRQRIRNAIYNAITAYTRSVPVEGSDVIINGQNLGPYTGDGFICLANFNIISRTTETHQWGPSDALIAPAVQIMPDMLKDIAAGNQQAYNAHYDLIRFFQTIMAENTPRRGTNPNDRWGNLQDTLHYSGAWADANLGHRSRAMLALPIIWADYNLPQTYVQYWYSSFYNNVPFTNFSFSPGWSPHGVLPDVARWMTKYKIAAPTYGFSGFLPDGTVAHHVANGTDIAMWSYGFEWLNDVVVGLNQFKNTNYQVADTCYQFPADRLMYVYPKVIYKQRLDFLVAGRAFAGDTKKFTTSSYQNAVNDLKAAVGTSTQIKNMATLDKVATALKNNTFEYSGTEAFWVNEFLVHRRGENESPFYVSLKLKSTRTQGPEDFGDPMRSYFAGCGMMPLRITGEEYNQDVLAKMDWHVLPGVTEEWRTDAFPLITQTGTGNNTIGGVTSNGSEGIGIYQHLPKDTYASAKANKSYYFINDKIIALGSNIQRLNAGQQHEIVTTIDQSAFINNITVNINGVTEIIPAGQSVTKEYQVMVPSWLHIGAKGYIIYPESNNTKLIIKTGNEINSTITSTVTTPNFIVALSHGTTPNTGNSAGYYYYMVPNITASQMPVKVIDYASIEAKRASGVHGIYSAVDKTIEVAFFSPATIRLGNMDITADQPSLLILKDNGSKGWRITASNPNPSENAQQLVFHVSKALPLGQFAYKLGGVYPRDGETVSVTADGAGSKIVVELPDDRDEAKYQYRAILYNAAPITVDLVPIINSSVQPIALKGASIDMTVLNNSVKITTNQSMLDGKVYFSVLDILGHELFVTEQKLTMGENRFNFPVNLSPGVYVAVLTSGTQRLVRKFLY